MATHHFQPRHYHTTMGSHDPLLCSADGDTVITTTVDARGHDASGEQVTESGNPQRRVVTGSPLRVFLP
jgi:hypothetical protein